MNKNDYLAALTRALADLPEDTTSSVIADYTQRFDAAVAAGQSEEEVARSMPNPGTVASTWWSTARGTSNQSRFDVAAYTSTMPPLASQTARPASRSVAGVVATSIGLVFLNLFMLIPAIVYAAIMTAALVVTLALYGGGIVVASSGLAGVDTVLVGKPMVRLLSGDHDLSSTDVTRAKRISIDAGTIRVDDNEEFDNDTAGSGHSKFDFMIGAGDDNRTMRVVKGVSVTLSGILALLIWLTIVRFTFTAVRHYVALNIAALRGR